MKDKYTEQEFTGAVRRNFENSIHDLEHDVASRLATIRARALAGRSSTSRTWLRMPVAALMFIGLAIVSYNFMIPSVTIQSYSPDEIEMMTTLDSLDLYDDVEFYEWLEGQGSPT
jgi:hypothetical protein